MKTICMFLLMTVISSQTVFASPMQIKYFQTDSRYTYRVKLLALILQKTIESHGPYTLMPYPKKVTQSRGLNMLESRIVDIAFLPTSREREEVFLPIKEPILRGVLGYRIFLIHRERALDFSRINTLEELTKRFQAGFGSQWADLAILKANDIRVIGIAGYDRLFKMLEFQRFEFFPRGINEAWNEIDQIKSQCPNLMVEENLALYYPYPVYFFVNKTNKRLADRIKRGLDMSFKDGSFKALFLEHHKTLINKAGLEKRKLFILKNPTIPEGTPEPDTSWWLSK